MFKMKHWKTKSCNSDCKVEPQKVKQKTNIVTPEIIAAITEYGNEQPRIMAVEIQERLVDN